MKVVVLGGGPIGLATAMLLARDGHDVTVLEKDAEGVPATTEEVYERWDRRGVAQFRQAHYPHARFRQVLQAELPDVLAELEASGGRRFNILNGMSPLVEDRSPREGDDRFETVTARRPVIEGAIARTAENEPGVKVLRGVAVDGPVSDRAVGGIPLVTGVRTSDGQVITADLVIDATGRRSKFVEWATGLGGVAPFEEITESGFAYYTRHYTSEDGSLPEYKGGFVSTFDSFFILTVPTDNNTWTIAIVAMAGDHLLKSLRNNDVWERVMRAVPNCAHWIDHTPVCDVLAMAGAMDRYRRFVVDGRPVIAGMVAVGDSWACTNPTMGRGLSLGIVQACALRDALREHADDPIALAVELDRVTEERLTPWYHQQVARDKRRSLELQALIDGRPVPPNDDPMAPMQTAFFTGAAYDADIARAFLENLSVLALPHEIMSRPGMLEKVSAYVGETPPQPPGPKRSDLAALLN